MKREIHKSSTFKQAEEWDILQNIRMTPEERQAAAAELKKRVYGKNAPDIKEAHGRIQDFLVHLEMNKVKYVIVGGEAVIYYGLARLTGDVDFFYEPSGVMLRPL